MTGLQAAAEIAKTHPCLPMLLISVQEVSTQLALEPRRLGFSGAVTEEQRSRSCRGHRGANSLPVFEQREFLNAPPGRLSKLRRDRLCEFFASGEPDRFEPAV